MDYITSYKAWAQMQTPLVHITVHVFIHSFIYVLWVYVPVWGLILLQGILSLAHRCRHCYCLFSAFCPLQQSQGTQGTAQESLEG